MAVVVVEVVLWWCYGGLLAVAPQWEVVPAYPMGRYLGTLQELTGPPDICRAGPLRHNTTVPVRLPARP